MGFSSQSIAMFIKQNQSTEKMTCWICEEKGVGRVFIFIQTIDFSNTRKSLITTCPHPYPHPYPHPHPHPHSIHCLYLINSMMLERRRKHILIRCSMIDRIRLDDHWLFSRHRRKGWSYRKKQCKTNDRWFQNKTKTNMFCFSINIFIL